MSVRNAEPAEDYEGLKKQFQSMKRLLISIEERIKHYDKSIEKYSFARIIQLEADLKSEKEMNCLLTEELENRNP